MKFWRWTSLILLLLATCVQAQALTVSAAISLKEAMSDIAAIYNAAADAEGGQKVQMNFGATGHLLAQIRQGAPVDVFVAASDVQMDQAAAMKLIDPATRRMIATNALVLIVPADSKVTLTGFDDLQKPQVKRLAMGEPKTVPAGEYAVQTLEHLKLYDVLKPKVISGSSVRQVLAYVERGEVDAGIVYATDAILSGDKVKIVATAEASWHDPIRYPAALVSATQHRRAAERFIEFVMTDAAQKALRRHGFSAPATQPTQRPAGH